MNLHDWVTRNEHLLTPEIYQRWEAMQRRHLPDREILFEVIKQVVAATSWRLGEERLRVLDLGCGPGSLLSRVLRFATRAWGIGIDADPFLLALARRVHTDLADRAVWLEADLRTTRLAMDEPFQAIVSSTTLHWLGRDSLAALYRRCAEVLSPGGVIAVADPMAGESEWRQGMIAHDDRRLKEENPAPGETWSEFYANLAAEWPGFGEAMEEFKRTQGLWEGTDDGHPWSFHEVALREAGFTEMEILYRHGRLAVYGAFKP